jgi:hypothetical protein
MQQTQWCQLFSLIWEGEGASNTNLQLLLLLLLQQQQGLQL